MVFSKFREIIEKLKDDCNNSCLFTITTKDFSIQQDAWDICDASYINEEFILMYQDQNILRLKIDEEELQETISTDDERTIYKIERGDYTFTLCFNIEED